MQTLNTIGYSLAFLLPVLTVLGGVMVLLVRRQEPRGDQVGRHAA